ncbi:MAG: creatininase family protein [Desulfobacterales bacterium]|nr:creatininase family protein [Desulfobacterales bacterium]
MDEFIESRIRKPLNLFEMTNTEAVELFKQTDIAIISVGSTEQHGRCLPMGTDTLEANDYAKRAAAIVEKEGIKVIITTPIPFGVSGHHMFWPGTLSLQPETLTQIVLDISECIIAHGVRKIILNVGHTGPPQESAMWNAAYHLQKDYGVLVSIFNRSRLYSIIKPKFLKAEKPFLEGHAGAHEASMDLAICPELVHMEWATKSVFPRELRGGMESSQPIVTSWAYKEPFKSGVRAHAVMMDGLREAYYAGTGAQGDVTTATKEQGENFLKYIAQELAKLIKVINEMDPIDKP